MSYFSSLSKENSIKGALNLLKKQLDIPIIVVCANGQESAKVVNILKTHGFKILYKMQGGLQAWKEADLPLVKN